MIKIAIYCPALTKYLVLDNMLVENRWQIICNNDEAQYRNILGLKLSKPHALLISSDVAKYCKNIRLSELDVMQWLRAWMCMVVLLLVCYQVL